MTLTPTLPESCAEASTSAVCDLKIIRPQIQDAANRVWQNYVSSERRTSQRDAEKANQVSGGAMTENNEDMAKDRNNCVSS